MALKYGTNRFNFIRGFLARISRPFMEFPHDVPGLFTSGDSHYDIAEWRTILLSSHISLQCLLERMVYCKCDSGKEHEFLTLHFRHWSPTQPHAITILVLDRTPRTDPTQNTNGSSRQFMQSSAIASPSVSQTAARDSIFTTPNKGSAIQHHLSTIHGRYKELCDLEFTGSARPSAIHVSILLSAVSEHAPIYDLYQYQCYWYAHTVWEALKQLFPDCRETMRHKGRSRYLVFNIEKADSVEVICEEYHSQWTRMEHEAEQKRQTEEARTQQFLSLQLLERGRADRQHEINERDRQINERDHQINERDRLIAKMQAELDLLKTQPAASKDTADSPSPSF
ncbi:uncharacterized protein BJ212DRAFT_1487922 [Suillus subaureus]|uniref:Uncharacterized protein n=1 Tax=Suillus subaureus TaxID=48587 RepID=A0A9P7J2Y1_9AGAM|nr:uncharacterized protein BJ212DRAFT_1487922 [Suillus subaureus]KAG1800640.1 hypothetical protein BJ212DRAFT_1487922 [Suillus subaureus]